MRCLAYLAVLSLPACGSPTADRNAIEQVEAEQREGQADGGRIACGRGEAAQLKPDCTIERSDSPAGLILTIRHPDGAFRRLLVTGDGRGVIAADGAEPARVSVVGPGLIVVSVGDEHYELPATVKGAGTGS